MRLCGPFLVVAYIILGVCGDKCTLIGRVLGSLDCCNGLNGSGECPKGSQPRCASTGNLDLSGPSCEPCPNDMYAPSPTTPHRPCAWRDTCDLPNMIYEDRGNTTHDVTCGCEEGYYMDQNMDLCILNGTMMTTTSILLTTESMDAEKLNIRTIIGIVIGSTLGLIFIIILIVYIKRKLKSRNCNGMTERKPDTSPSKGTKEERVPLQSRVEDNGNDSPPRSKDQETPKRQTPSQGAEMSRANEASVDFGTGPNKNELLVDTRFQAILQRNIVRLTQGINMLTLKGHLVNQGVVQDADMENIMACRTNNDQVTELISHLKRGDIRRFDGFLQALWNSDHRSVVTQTLGLSPHETAPQEVEARPIPDLAMDQAGGARDMSQHFNISGGNVTLGNISHTSQQQQQQQQQQASQCGGAGPGFKFKDYEDDMSLENCKPVADFFKSKQVQLTTMKFNAKFWSALVQEDVINAARKDVIKETPGDAEKAGELLSGIRTVGHFRRLLLCISDHDGENKHILFNIGMSEDNIKRK